MSGSKTFLWRTLSVAVLLFSAKIASAEFFLFGLSDFVNDVNRLTINGTQNILSGADQGWWSGEWDRTDASNPNYLVGSFVDSPPGLNDYKTRNFNNYFIFDISGVQGPVSTAQLKLQFNTPVPSAPGNVNYYLYDVSTDLVKLNDDLGSDADIFNDLGSGTSYGVFSVPTEGDWEMELVFELNSAALADLNAAIENGAPKFAIGGTLLAPKPQTRSVPDSASTLALFGVAAASLWALRRRKSA